MAKVKTKSIKRIKREEVHKIASVVGKNVSYVKGVIKDYHKTQWFLSLRDASIILLELEKLGYREEVTNG